MIVGRTPILPLADSAAFGPCSLFCDWVLAVFMPIDDRLRLRLLLIINNGSDRRSSSAANSPSDYKLGQAAECGMGLGLGMRHFVASFSVSVLGSLCFWGFIWEISFSLLFLLVICMRYLELL